MFRKTTIALIVFTLFVGGVAALAYFAGQKTTVLGPPPTPISPPGQVYCTMEARQCPDGSYVGRQGPKCEFGPCPSMPSGSVTCGPNEGSCQKGYTCIQHCGPPVVRQDEPSLTWYCETDEIARKPRMCPICLAKDTRIGTTGSGILVQDVKIGDRIWSMDRDGKKITSRVIAVTRTPVPKTHRVVHLALADGRELWVSPDHPTSTGTRVGDLRAGESYDGSRVAMAELVPYGSDATFDLLPDSETGLYWADGILMGSTLQGR